MAERTCSVKTTFTQTFESDAAANRAHNALTYAVGEGVIANSTAKPNGKVEVEATLSCTAGQVGGKCLLEALSAAGLKFPQELYENCLRKKS